jgi:UrcA family protein
MEITQVPGEMAMLKTYAPSSLIAIALASVLAAAATPATSGSLQAPSLSPDHGPNFSAMVHYQDLDLTTDAGRIELQHRVRVVARILCDQGPDLVIGSELTCENEAVASAAEMQRQVIAEARARSHVATPADQVAVAAVAHGR